MATALFAQAVAPRLANEAQEEEASFLTGTTADVQLARRTAAVLKNGTDGLGFYPVTTTTTVKANTAYVAEPRILLIDLSSLDAPVVGIGKVGNEVTSSLPTDGFDLSGRRVTRNKKGVIVKKRQKVLVVDQ